MNNLPIDQVVIFSMVAAIAVAIYLKGMIGKKKIKAALAGGALVVDVRSPAEYGAGHFSGAINIPHDKIASSFKKLGDPGQTIVVYCASGARSSAAASVLKNQGFSKVINAGRMGAMPF